MNLQRTSEASCGSSFKGQLPAEVEIQMKEGGTSLKKTSSKYNLVYKGLMLGYDSLLSSQTKSTHSMPGGKGQNTYHSILANASSQVESSRRFWRDDSSVTSLLVKSSHLLHALAHSSCT